MVRIYHEHPAGDGMAPRVFRLLGRSSGTMSSEKRSVQIK
jgi:hypothetical protein